MIDRPARFQARRGAPISVVMNVSTYRGSAGDEAAHAPREPAGLDTEPAHPRQAGPPESHWTEAVEALAAHWQAALGGFHHTGAPPGR